MQDGSETPRLIVAASTGRVISFDISKASQVWSADDVVSGCAASLKMSLLPCAACAWSCAAHCSAHAALCSFPWNSCCLLRACLPLRCWFAAYICLYLWLTILRAVLHGAFMDSGLGIMNSCYSEQGR